MQIATVEDTASELDMINGLVRTWLDARNLVVDIACFTAAEGFFAAWSPRMFSLVLLDCILSPDASEPSGMDIAMRIRERDDAVPIVFITTSRDFAIEGYAVQAADYLLKPVTQETLFFALDRTTLPATLVRIGGQEIDVAVEDVTWCRAINHGVEPHFSQGSRFVRTTLRDTADALASHGDFVQSARGYLVNLAHVLKIDGLDFVLVNGEKVPISRDNSGAMRSAWADFAFERARRRV